MKQFFRITTVALISGGLLAASSALAQQANSSQNNQAQNNQTQSNQSQYTGVSTPPDQPIIANEPNTPPPTQAQPHAQPKPSAAIPAQPSSTAQAQPPAQPADTAPDTTPYTGVNATAASNTPAVSASNNPNRYNNTDFGIVTKLPNPRATQQVEAMNARLYDRPSNPSYGVVSVVPFIPHALNPGTNITVRLLQPLSTSSTPQGTPFRATVVSPVYRGSQLIIPAGSELRGVVTDVHTGRHLISRATLRLTPHFVLLPDGNAYRMDAEAIYTSAHHAHTTNEGTFQPRMRIAKDSAEYGAGAGLGALVGAKFGPGGALIGTLVGAGAVSAHMLLQPPSSLTLPRNTEVIFSLTQPMELTPTRD